MMSGGDGVGWMPPASCTNPKVLMENLCSVWSKDSTAERKKGDHWVAFSKAFQLMDDRYYTLQALKFTNPNSKRLDEVYVVKLFNDRGKELGKVDRYPCSEGVEGTFQRSIDVLFMEQALEQATGQLVRVYD